MSHPKRKEQCVDKEIADRFPNDWLEATIVVVMLAAIAGGAYMMYLLSQA